MTYCENEYERLRELILIQEFKNCLSNKVRTFVNDKKPQKLSDASRLADNFTLTHKLSTNSLRSNPSFPPRGTNNGAYDNKRVTTPSQFQGRFPSNNIDSFTGKPRNDMPDYSPCRQPPFRPVFCDHCKR